MASVIRGSDDFDSQDVNIGAAKAWVNFDGTGTVAIRDSFNVDSITDNGTGDFTVNFTEALGDANYSVSGSAGNSGAGNRMVSAITYATDSCRINTYDATNIIRDNEFVSVTIHGN